MSLASMLFAYTLGFLFIALILFVIFGQTTVRKLRKNPETTNELGMEFASGWDILNVASALALPKWLNRKFRKSRLAFLSANAEILDKNTNTYDRVLAIIFFVLFYSSGTSLIILSALDAFGVFD